MVEHAGTNGECPDYGSRYDPCPRECASGVCLYSREYEQKVEAPKHVPDHHFVD